MKIDYIYDFEGHNNVTFSLSFFNQNFREIPNCLYMIGHQL